MSDFKRKRTGSVASQDSGRGSSRFISEEAILGLSGRTSSKEDSGPLSQRGKTSQVNRSRSPSSSLHNDSQKKLGPKLLGLRKGVPQEREQCLERYLFR